ncbi:MAG: hypothetical protein M3160_00335 [Candidatus Eremiobacteraeota bacterium]|nr:hypothetical protein [Candidatus Eremiobacteraeota bacterium]
MNAREHFRALVAGLFAVALSVCAPCARAQQPTPLPRDRLIITDCRGGVASIELVEVAAYDVTFRNTSSLSADEVRLTVRTHRNKLLHFDLKGTFSPGIDVKRRVGKTLGLGLYSYSSSNNQCSIDWVHFVDGSSWTGVR